MWSKSKTAIALASALIGLQLTTVNAQQRQHNVILFVPDGLRAAAVTPQTAPTMAAIRDQGVNFANPQAATEWRGCGIDLALWGKAAILVKTATA